MASPELPEDLNQLRVWYEEENNLERDVAKLMAKVQENDRRLARARKQVAEGRAQKEHAIEIVPKLGRRRRELSTRSSEMAAALRAELESGSKRQKDNRGLQRSLAKLQQRLGHAALQAGEFGDAVRQQAELEDAALIEEESLCLTIAGLEEVHDKLSEKVAAERRKRLQLKQAAIAKLERDDQSQAGLRQKVKEHEAAILMMRDQLAEQEARTQFAEEELARSHALLSQARSYVDQQQEARNAMHRQLLDVEMAVDSLRTDLEVTNARVQEITESEGRAQQSWRLKHMEKLDSKIRARQDMDKDILVADEPHVQVSVGGC